MTDVESGEYLKQTVGGGRGKRAGGRRSGGGVKISTRGGPQVPRLGNTFYGPNCLLFWWIRQKI